MERNQEKKYEEKVDVDGAVMINVKYDGSSWPSVIEDGRLGVECVMF